MSKFKPTKAGHYWANYRRDEPEVLVVHEQPAWIEELRDMGTVLQAWATGIEWHLEIDDPDIEWLGPVVPFKKSPST